MTVKQQKAHDYFYGGYNCAQSVFAAFHQETGLDEALALRLTVSLGGGVCGMRDMCGAVIGSAMVLGLMEGEIAPGDQEKKKALYARVQALADTFKQQYGTVNCGKLLELNDITPSPVPAKRDEKYYEERPCGKYVEACAKLVEDELSKG